MMMTESIVLKVKGFLIEENTVMKEDI